MRAIPTREGAYWGMWKIAEEATEQAYDYTPSRLWEVISVELIDGELAAYVPGVPTAQSVENFFWATGLALTPPPTVPITLDTRDDETARAYARYRSMTPAQREEFLQQRKVKQ